MKRILGLDLGTNSIGWALINHNFNKKDGKIEGLGSRIIPMSQDVLGKFDSGVSISQTADRTKYRGTRRLYQRSNLRRERLHRVLNILGFLPKHYVESIDFEKHFGQFKKNTEVKLNYQKKDKEYKDNEKVKYEFLFISSFNEMVKEFEKNHHDNKIPYDWTLYYLRKKALSQKISKEELAWVILNFNQKRGYYQLRGEEEENKLKLEEFHALKVVEVETTEQKNANGIWYNVILENGWIYKRQSKESLNSWIGKIKEFIITTSLEKDGTFKKDKEGNIKRSFRVPKEDDWKLLKKKTEQDINTYIGQNDSRTIGTYIYEKLLENPTQKIRGKLVKMIERKYYKEEFKAIIKEQIKHHKELKDKNLYKSCILELYPRNEAHINNIKDKDFNYLFTDDIIFYHRPLKSKKSTIANCQYEYRIFNIDGVAQPKQYLKTISKSHPLFQEFRLWQFLKNLKIYQKNGFVNEKPKIDIDITSQLFKTEDDWVELFDFLSIRKEVEQKNVIQYLISKKIIKKDEKNNYRWNYVEDKKYPCNPTKSHFLTRLKKVKNIDIASFYTKEIEFKLWHIVYSVKDKKEYEEAIKNFAIRNKIDEDSFVANFLKFPPFKNDYGAYSEKTIKKLLPLMRRGKYWNETKIIKEVKYRIESIMERVNTLNLLKNSTKKQINDALEKIEVADDDIPKQLIKSFIPFIDLIPFTALNTYQACYAVYNRFAEPSSISQWKHPQDITHFLKDSFKQHSLRNPIVEQVVTETLRTVRDIWEYYGNGNKKFFDEIHVELGREMKNSADKRKKISGRISENENTNYRIKEILKELKNEGIKSIKPYSSSQQEILKIYEEGIFKNPDVKYSDKFKEDEIEKIRKNSVPSKSDIIKYKLWLNQGYISPYTGKVIQLSKLFTTDYQIEHIIPQSRYFDNSMSNKIICESEVNSDKSNMTAYEYILKKGGSLVDGLSILKLDAYEKHCNQYFKKNRTKLKNLLSENIPDGFINRQLNDSRYISKLIKGLLSNLVRDENEQEATSKHLVPIAGSITSKLKHDWGLNDKWNELIAPRFKRLNELTDSNDFGYWDNKINAFRTQVPDNIAKGFSKKRIDHRHHALDALVIACCTRKHTNYLSALNAENKNYALRDSLLIKSKEGHYTKHFLKPWNSFIPDAKSVLEKTIISFKQNTRVINKTNNKTWKWKKQKDGKFKKELVPQTEGDNWAIRKPMHKETVSGKINFIVAKGKIATATRVSLSEITNQKKLEKITDKSIQIILENHLKNYLDKNGNKQFNLAFDSDGVEELNKNIKNLNNGKNHHPIYKVRLYEVGNKFAISENKSSQKNKKFVEAAKGTNLFFAIYYDEEKKKRVYETIPLNEVIEHQKQVASLTKSERTLVPINNTKGNFLFSLSPYDLVYVPTNEELENKHSIDFTKLSKEQVNRVMVVNDFSGVTCNFTPNQLSKAIITKEVDLSFDKKKNKLVGSHDIKTAKLYGNSIKDRCWKIKLDRLGNIIDIIK